MNYFVDFQKSGTNSKIGNSPGCLHTPLVFEALLDVLQPSKVSVGDFWPVFLFFFSLKLPNSERRYIKNNCYGDHPYKSCFDQIFLLKFVALENVQIVSIDHFVETSCFSRNLP